MKIIVKKEFDGKNYIGSCENLPNCYAQAQDADQLLVELRTAIENYRKSYSKHKQSLPKLFDRPVIDKKIRFNKISAQQLSELLLKNHYHVDYKDNNSLIFINDDYPFNRIHVPNTDDLSPMIISGIFGKENVIYVNKNRLSLNSSA